MSLDSVFYPDEHKNLYLWASYETQLTPSNDPNSRMSELFLLRDMADPLLLRIHSFTCYREQGRGRSASNHLRFSKHTSDSSDMIEVAELKTPHEKTHMHHLYDILKEHKPDHVIDKYTLVQVPRERRIIQFSLWNPVNDEALVINRLNTYGDPSPVVRVHHLRGNAWFGCEEIANRDRVGIDHYLHGGDRPTLAAKLRLTISQEKPRN